MNSVEETGLSQIVDLPLIGSAEQDLFSVENNRERADKLQELLVPKLKVLIEQACDLIHQVYGTDVLSHCRITTTPAHRPGAKKTKPFKEASAGLAIKGKSWYFQQRFECTSDSLYVKFFGLRGLEGNPIVQVLKNHLEDVTRILEQGRYEVYSEAIALPGEAEELDFYELINKLQLVPEGDWKGTYIQSPSLVLPIKDLDAAQPVIDNFVTLFALFRAAMNVFLDEEDRFEDYVKCLWDWQSPLQVQESVTTTRFFPDEVDSVQTFREGAVRQVLVNAYERDPKARQKCIDSHGSSCSICGFDFGRDFGQLGKGFIHVHHLRPLSEIAEEYEIDPINDLRPVCPNCHAMIHRRSPPFSLEEIKMLWKSAGGSTI